MAKQTLESTNSRSIYLSIKKHRIADDLNASKSSDPTEISPASGSSAIYRFNSKGWVGESADSMATLANLNSISDSEA